jgi:hypothetical protein
LLDRINRDPPPLVQLVRNRSSVRLADHALRQQRHDAAGAEFGRLLHDELECLALGQRLQERDALGQGWDEPFSHDRQRDPVARDLAHFALVFVPRAIQHNHRLAAVQAQNPQAVVRLAFGERQRCARAVFGREMKTVHGLCLKRCLHGRGGITLPAATGDAAVPA